MRLRATGAVVVLVAASVGYAAGSKAFWLQPTSVSRLQWLTTKLNASYRSDCSGQNDCVGFTFAANEKRPALIVIMTTFGSPPLEQYEDTLNTALKVARMESESEFGRLVDVEVRRIADGKVLESPEYERK